ncbi:hypothetical protein ACFQ1I_26055 [Kitasatospora arboriphila]
MLTCNEHNTADGVTACARQAIDAKAVAVVGSYSQYGGSFVSTLEQAGIPYLGGYGLSTPEFSSPLSYPVAERHARADRRQRPPAGRGGLQVGRADPPGHPG